MPLNPAPSAGPSALASARHLALPSPGPRRARLEDRIRIAVHRRTGRTDVKPPLFITSTFRRAGAEPSSTTASPEDPAQAQHPSDHRVGKQLVGLALGVTALGALLALGAAGALGALLVAAG